MINFKKLSILISSFVIGFSQLAFSWTPSKEIQIISHAKETSSTYAFARAVMKAIEDEKLLPNGVSVKIVGGARGGKARNYVLNTNADPHVLQVLTPSQINNVILTKQEVGYKNAKGIAALAVTPLLMTVNSQSEYKSLDDVINKAKSNPGKVVQAGGAFGQVASLVGKMISDEKSVNITYAPFDDEGVLQLLGGHVDFILENPGQVFKFVDAGKMRLLASSVKLDSKPDVPTFKEAGYNGVILAQYRGLWFSDKNTEAQRNFYIDLMKKVSETKSFKEYISKNNSYWVRTTLIPPQACSNGCSL
jgi:putative tricarboxylic transport membrane protein